MATTYTACRLGLWPP